MPKAQEAYIFLWLSEGQNAVLQPMTPYGRASQPFSRWCRKLCELWHTSQVPHSEEQGQLRWTWQDGDELSVEAVLGAGPHIPAGSPPPYDGTTLKSPCQYGPVTGHVTETCITPALDSLVSRELQNGPHETCCSLIWKVHSRQWKILIVFPFQLWLYGNIIASTFVPDKREKNEKNPHSKKRKFTQ